MQHRELKIRLEILTGRKTSGKTWKQLVGENIIDILLPHPQSRVADRYMFFVSEFANSLCHADPQMGTELLTIALQRILYGAVPHPKDLFKDDINIIDDHLRVTYYYKPHPMTEGCYVFIMKDAMKTCLKNKQTRKLALAILFGLLDWIEPDGRVEKNIDMLGDFRHKSACLYLRAKTLVEEYATVDEIFYRYACRDQWQKHKMWFADHFQVIDWNCFFRDTHVLDGCNFITKAIRKRKIKTEIYKLSLPKAM